MRTDRQPYIHISVYLSLTVCETCPVPESDVIQIGRDVSETVPHLQDGGVIRHHGVTTQKNALWFWDFRRVQNVVCILLGISPTSEV